jgi:hypothetical protein
LDAVRELFPEKFAEVEVIRGDLRDAFRRGEVSDPRLSTPDTLPEPVQKRIHLWAKTNGISCDAVEKMAALIVAGDTRPPTVTVELSDAKGNPFFEIKDTKGDRRNVLLIRADPFCETLEQFIVRARAHYKQACGFYQKLGYKIGPGKRERDHFRYLAAHLVGGYSWAQLAPGNTPLNLPVGAERSIAEGARETARLIGLPMRTTPGPRPGTRLRPTRHRARGSSR